MLSSGVRDRRPHSCSFLMAGVAMLNSVRTVSAYIFILQTERILSDRWTSLARGGRQECEVDFGDFCSCRNRADSRDVYFAERYFIRN